MKELKKKLIMVKKIKFIRNICVGIVSLVLVALIINIAPGYKRDKYKDVTNLIINEENKTEELKHNIYINENKTVYISEEDIRNFFDKNIYYDTENNQIITTSDTKVANIVVDEKKMVVNNTNVELIDAIIRIDNNIYLPISKMSIVYNIDVQYIENKNRVVIDELNKGMIRAIVSEETSIKFKPRGMSKNIGTLKEGETVYCFYTTSKGWRQIRTQDGTLRIYKSKQTYIRIYNKTRYGRKRRS